MFNSKKSAAPRAKRGFVSKRQWAIGVAVVLLAVTVDRLGLLGGLEYWFDDKRAEYFDSHSPEPSPEVVLIAIDGDSLDTIDMWPIKRRVMAEVVRELDRAGASVIAFDMIFDDAEEPEITGDIADPSSLEISDGDALLAQAIRDHGNVLLATSFIWEEAEETSAAGVQSAPRVPFSDVYDTMVTNLGITFDDLRRTLASSGWYDARLIRELSEFDEGGTIKDLRNKYGIAKVMLDSAPVSSIPAPADGRPWPRSTTPEPPVPTLAESMDRLASVTFSSFDIDQRVRRIPLWVRHGGQLYPMLGLAAVAAHLGIDSSDLRLEDGDVVLETDREGVATRLEMHEATLRRQGRKYGLHYITWPRSGVRLRSMEEIDGFSYEKPLFGFGVDRGWIGQFRSDLEEGMIVENERRRAAGEAIEMVRGDEAALGTRMIAIGKILDPYLIIERIRENVDRIDGAMNALYEQQIMASFDVTLYNQRAAELRKTRFEDERWGELLAAQRPLWEEMAATATELVSMFEGYPESEMPAEELAMKRTLEQLPSRVELLLTEIDEGERSVRVFRTEVLPRLVGGKICFVGWTATGAARDFVSTSVDPKTPGVLVHMAVANAVLSDHVLRFGPWWLDVASIVGLGLLGTWIGVRFPVLIGPLALLGVMGVLFIVNGRIFWDQNDTRVALGLPFATAGLSWIGVILDRLIVERRGRKRTEARFRSYVSPEVVDILVSNPNLSSMAPQKKELTIFFSDIAGFTTLSEKLGTEGIKDLLGVYLGTMTEELQKHRATIDKYIGDAIMAFWGAPVDDPDHARHGALAALGQQRLLAELNANRAFDERAGILEVRMGLATGEVNVGDFGNPPNKSAYTVIGDHVNLAARLESGCKQFGVDIMITDDMRRKMGDDLTVRPLGRIVVKGKSEPEMIYELLGDRAPHGAATEAWIDCTSEGVEAYISGDFQKSLRAFEKLTVEFKEQRLAEIYRRSISHMESLNGSLSDFDGSIVLSEK